MKLLLMTLLFFMTLVTKCQNATVNVITDIRASVVVTYTHSGNYTRFYVTSNLESVTISDSWLGIGLNSDDRMNGADVVICRNPPEPAIPRIFHNLNNDYSSNYLVSSDEAIGISDFSIEVKNGNLTCSFVRDNTLNVAGVYKIVENVPGYIVAAYGSGEFGYHTQKGVAFINFALTTTSTSTTKTTPISKTASTKPTTELITTTLMEPDTTSPSDTITPLTTRIILTDSFLSTNQTISIQNITLTDFIESTENSNISSIVFDTSTITLTTESATVFDSTTVTDSPNTVDTSTDSTIKTSKTTLQPRTSIIETLISTSTLSNFFKSTNPSTTSKTLIPTTTTLPQDLIGSLANYLVQSFINLVDLIRSIFKA